MDSGVIDLAKEKLLSEKEKLTEQLEAMTQEKTFDKDRVQSKWANIGDKEEDNAVEVANFQDNISLERTLETTLEKIDKALGKFDKGTYGACEECGKEISEERLLAYPEAQHCIECHVKSGR
ncbi:MAG: TraR/DksA C4-type zinc finger protein [Patescibacteria group bacterium]